MENRTINLEIRQKNRSAIFRLFREREALSRQEIVQILGLSLPTVTHNLDELIAEGLVTVSGSLGNTGGRRAKTYSLVRDARTAIGIDVKKHSATAVALDLEGTVIGTVQRNVPYSSTDAYYRLLGEMVSELVQKAKLRKDRILGVGIGVPGLVSRDNQTVFYGEILNFTGMTAEDFGRYIPYPVALHNDANASSFAEFRAYPDTPDAFYIMLSNNVGGSVYIDGQPYIGTNIRSGEVGHMIIVPDGKQCYCGQKGCVDVYCAATVLASAAKGDLSLFFWRLKEGDPDIRRVWEEYLGHLALTVVNLRMLFDCPIIIGGYVGAYIEEYMDELKALLKDRNTFDPEADYLRPCRFKGNAIACGAALYNISAFLNSI
ncbi:MAG: ROK family transcriptional regulator [Oscillospiraceae bacterium]|nr:ROK family transcriptional regulator [Oscillospiraceae bacterium]